MWAGFPSKGSMASCVCCRGSLCSGRASLRGCIRTPSSSTVSRTCSAAGASTSSSEGGDVVFPLGMGQLEIYGDRPPVGTDVACRIAIREMQRHRIRVEAEIVRPDGTIWMRIRDWEDWRFHWPGRYRDVFRQPRDNLPRRRTAPERSRLRTDPRRHRRVVGASRRHGTPRLARCPGGDPARPGRTRRATWHAEAPIACGHTGSGAGSPRRRPRDESGSPRGGRRCIRRTWRSSMMNGAGPD